MEVIIYIMESLLRPVLEDTATRQDTTTTTTTTSQQASTKRRQVIIGQDQDLDLDGPKMWPNCRAWIIFYQVIGQINLPKVPLIISIIYKCCVLSLASYVCYNRYLIRLLNTNLLSSFSKNPISILMTFLALLVNSAQVLNNLYLNLFSCSPMYKILTTEKLCFLSDKIQIRFGSKSLRECFVFYMYNCVLFKLFICDHFQEFIDEFRLSDFFLELFAQTVMIYYVIGMAHFDFFIRGCFASWLLSLKSNLDNRFIRFHQCQEQQLREYIDSRGQFYDRTIPQTKFKLVYLDDIQKQLNNMDDHLEAMRSVQVMSYTGITLLAFLVNGTLTLFTYNILANQGNYYHGIVLSFLTINYFLLTFYCYLGDQFVFYSLLKLVQTIEDEYFLQKSEPRSSNHHHHANPSETTDLVFNSPELQQLQLEASSLVSSGLESPGVFDELTNDLLELYDRLTVREKDVLFSREFLHQFECHLATPWSKLTVNTHLHMLGTFFTLIAAQIIFEHLN